MGHLRRVLQYQLKLTTEEQTIKMPVEAKLLRLHRVNGSGETLTISALVSDKAAKVLEARTFILVGSDQPIKQNKITYIGTYAHNEKNTWYCFEVTDGAAH